VNSSKNRSDVRGGQFYTALTKMVGQGGGLEDLARWLDKISTSSFQKVLLPTLVQSVEDLTHKILKLSGDITHIEEGARLDEVVFKDGRRFYGFWNKEFGIPEGRGQVILEDGKALEGEWKEGRLEGLVRQVDPSDGSVLEIEYKGGLPCGTYRHLRGDGQLLGYGRCKGDQRYGPCLRVGSGGNSYFFHGTDLLEDEENEPEKGMEEGAYLYPSLAKAIVGSWKIKDGDNYSTAEYRVIEGQYWTVGGIEWKDGWPQLLLGDEGRGEVSYDPATFMRISRAPLVPDEYEEETVQVGLSSVPGAGEGLFARVPVEAGSLLSLFSGNRISKGHSRRGVRWGDEEWSDFRLTLDKSVDLDIPPDMRLTSQYRATLGHKACHDFAKKNAAFQEFEHPRFGCIMSVVALRDIEAGEEVFVSYNYCIGSAPPWYQDLWWQYCKEQGWSQGEAEKWAERYTSRTGIPVKVPDFSQ